ncbi:MAG: DUF4412 domain-containing protein [Puia sp.]
MKKTIIKSAVVTGMIVFGYAGAVNAQFFKQILNDVKQTAQNRADNKATSTTNKALDKVDNSTQAKPKSNNTSATGHANPAVNSGVLADTAATNSVLGAFAKAAQQNPNDTSAADLTMKALGLLAGGGGVSAADSAAAIKSFASGNGGSGYLYETVTTSTSSKGAVSRDTAKSYIAGSGNGRSEMRINIPGAMSNQMIVIGHASDPKYSISLYPDSRTYSLNIIDSSLINSGRSVYQVTKIGTENIQGYRCTHVKLTTTSGSGMFKSTTTMNLWTSTDIPGYEVFKKLSGGRAAFHIDMMQALEKAGCAGYLVKMQDSEKDYSVNMVLVKAEKQSFPDNLFVIPPGYTKSSGNMISHMISRQ